MEKYVKNLILIFFRNDLVDKEKENIEKIVNELIKNLSNDFFKKCLLDKSYLPLGLKFYLKEKNKDFSTYFYSGFFKPDFSFKSSYITNVSPNPYVFNLFFLTLKNIFKNKIKDKNRSFNENIFFKLFFMKN